MKTLRLLLWEECNRNCSQCQNKNWDLSKLPVCRDYSGYDQILLTGGEPMLHPNIVLEVVKRIREHNTEAKIFMYTANVVEDYREQHEFVSLLQTIDGATVTCHTPEEVIELSWMVKLFQERLYKGKSLKANLFPKAVICEEEPQKLLDAIKTIEDNPNWNVKYKSWVTKKHLPKDEEFMRLF